MKIICRDLPAAKSAIVSCLAVYVVIEVVDVVSQSFIVAASWG